MIKISFTDIADDMVLESENCIVTPLPSFLKIEIGENVKGVIHYRTRYLLPASRIKRVVFD